MADLLRQGHTDIRSVDNKPITEWYQVSPKVENLQLDLGRKEACEQALQGAHTVCVISRRTWAGWGSSRTTKPCAC